MKNKYFFFILLVLLFFNAGNKYAEARKLICIDSDPNDNGFLSNGEGWERQNLKPGDEIHVGGSLDDCLKHAKNGDTIIIYCHGWGQGKGFKWGGTRYRGFGTGDSLHPVPPGTDTLKNVHVVFTSCWSERDPDGEGPDKPVTDKLKDKMGPPSNGNSVEGFTNRVYSGCIPYIIIDTTKTDTATINNFMRNGNQAWQKFPPVNRDPPAQQNQKTKLQELLDSVKGGAGKVTVTDIKYKKPYNGTSSPLDTCNCNCNTDEDCGCTEIQTIYISSCSVFSYSWSPQISGTSNILLTVSAVNSKICWAAGAGPTILRTIDGGSTWTSVSVSGISGDVYNIFAVDADTAFCTTSPSSTFIYKTTNGGATWTTVFTQPGGFIDAIQMTSGSEGYAVGDPVGGKWTVLKTTNCGSTWFRMATEPFQIGTEAGWNNSLMVINSYIWFGTNSSKVYRSSNYGTTWAGIPTPGVTSSYALHFNNTTEGLAGGTGMVKSTNGGASYIPATNPAVNISGIDGFLGTWWSVAFNSIIYLSTNQGINWIPVYNQPANVYNDIDVTADGGCAVGWAVDNSGNITKMSGEQNTVLNLAVLPEGFWNGSVNVPDTMKVNIRKTVSPYNVVDYSQGMNSPLGNLSLTFTNPEIRNGNSYYIEVKHRNSIRTWSRTGGESWTASYLNYDFTMSPSMAYGSNEILKGGRYCIFSGDVNQDDIVDGTDGGMVDNDAFNFNIGYLVTDVNGDGIIDGSDGSIVDNNAFNFVSAIVP